MKKDHLKVALRNFIRYKWNSIFNLLGLSFGIACSVYLFILIDYEVGYDRFHDDIDLVFRMCTRSETERAINYFACITQKNSDYIRKNYDGIEYMARYAPNRPAQVTYNDKSFLEARQDYVEPEIFKIIKAEFILGNSETCLDRPNTVVITNSVRHKYFGDSDPLGKLMKIDTLYFEVTGVIRDMPENSRFRHDFYESWITYEKMPAQPGHDITGRFLTTYIKFKPDSDIEAFKEWIKGIPELLDENPDGRSQGNSDLFIQKVKSLHLARSENFIWDWEDSANPVFVYILIGTVMLILIMSGLNYINLNIASYSVRIREVGIRKSAGATRRQLILQFLSESILAVFVAHIFGLFLVELFLPLLNDMTEMNLVINYKGAGIWIVIFFIIIILGVGAGSYPAFYLTRLSPVKAINDRLFKGNGRVEFKELLIILQFAMSIILIIGTILIFKQVSFMKNRELGVSLENKLIIELPQGDVSQENAEMVKENFTGLGLFSGASISSSVPGKSTYTWRLWPTGEENTNFHSINCMEIDYDYVDLYGLQVVAGSSFDRSLGYESNRGYIFNEEAVKVFGWNSFNEALLKTIGRGTPLRGVMKNFHYRGLQKDIEPLGMFLGSYEDARYLTLQAADIQNRSGEITRAREKYEELFPGKIFNYFFLKEEFNSQYRSEDKTVKLFMVFTIMAVIIAIIGLFGMTAFYCMRKEKSTGIRRVFGADRSDILLSLLVRFSIWVTLSFIIAVPVSVIGVKMWLENFAYKAGISALAIIIAGLLSLLVTISTVLYHSFRLSGKNPVDIIRYE